MNTIAECTLETLETTGFLTHDQVAKLQAIVRARANIAICGPTGAGKSQLARALVDYAFRDSPAERIAIVGQLLDQYNFPQDNAIAFEHDNDRPFIHTFQMATRFAPERYFVDDYLRGPEAYDVLRTVTHTRGSVIALHTPGTTALECLTQLVRQHAQGEGVAEKLVESTIDVVIDMKNRLTHRDPATALFIHRAADLSRAR